MLRDGFLGLGMISHENVLGYLDNPDVDMVAVCSESKTAAREWLEKWNLPKARIYEDYEKMLASEKLDLVEILTPHHLHCSMAVKCAEAKVKGISLQKP